MTSAPPETPSDRVVAEVDGHPIYLSEVGDAIRAMPAEGGQNSLEALFPAALRQLIEREALAIRAREEGVGNDPEVRRRVQAAADQIMASAYLERATSPLITDEALLARYDAEIKGKPGPEEVHGRAILVPTEAAAKEIIAKLAAGADFATLARQSSKDPTSVSGGDLGFVRRESLSPEGAAVLFVLRPGEVTPYPVRSPYGWFVLKAEERRLAPTPLIGEARDQLEAEIEREHAATVVHDALSHSVVHAYGMNGQGAYEGPAAQGDAATPPKGK